MAGRKTKYTPETVKKLTDAIRLGATYRLACLYAGISDETFARWQVRYVDFVDVISRAEGEAVIGWLAKMEKAANDGDWRAALEKLSRRYPSEYGKTAIDTTVRGDPERPIAFIETTKPDGA